MIKTIVNRFSSKVALPDLPYDYHELSPVISKTLLEFHYKKHHQTYINNFNIAMDKLNSFLITIRHSGSQPDWPAHENSFLQCGWTYQSLYLLEKSFTSKQKWRPNTFFRTFIWLSNKVFWIFWKMHWFA